MKPYWKALTVEQRRVLQACAKPTARWNAYLAGGTALALQLGHRQSEDLDWFTAETLDPGQLLADTQAMGFPLTVVQNDVGTFLAMVGSVKLSVFRYRYPMLDAFVVSDGAKLAGLRDLAAMKLAAVMARATMRDYVDIHQLLLGKHLTLPAMLEAFQAKYPATDPSGALRALTFFDDVIGEMPIMLTKTTWKGVTADLARIAQRYL